VINLNRSSDKKDRTDGSFYSEKFTSLSLLQEERFTSLDDSLQRNIDPLLRYLIEIHSKVHGGRTVESHGARIATLKRTCVCSAENLAAKAKGIHREVDSALLRALRFSSMTHRAMEIAESHRKTFLWLLHQCTSQTCEHLSHGARPWSNFIQWLRDDSGIYWINGKAGSGKSTLMRFISEQTEVQSHLNHWRGQGDIHVSHFYFWNSGSELQRSQPGLLRSLLFHALQERPELTRFVFPEEWNDACPSENDECDECIYGAKPVRLPDYNSYTFSTKILEKAFLRLAGLTTKEFRFCFFIDGLDEYEGDPELLTELLKKVSEYPFVKMCVSSRPWLVFEEAFEQSPSLRLQDLTWKDIQQYVGDKLQANLKMQQLGRSEPFGAASILKSIISKANGVFLWVRIVTTSLLNGLRNQDSISDLQRRIDVLPSELDTLYCHMIDRVDPLYFDQASRIFRIFDVATELKLGPTILQLELALSTTYTDATSSLADQPMSDEEIKQRCGRMAAHLKSRCEGLLETHDFLDGTWESVEDIEDVERSPIEPTASEPGHSYGYSTADGIKLKMSSKVWYLHRTVKDFLKTDATRSKLQQCPQTPAEFHPNVSLLISYLMNLKRRLYTFHSHVYWGDVRIERAVCDFFSIARDMSLQSEEVHILLHSFRDSAFRWWLESTFPVKRVPSYQSWRAQFLSLANQHGLWQFAQEESAAISNGNRKRMLENTPGFEWNKRNRLLKSECVGEP
jgi:hypothetical protein